MSMRTCLAIFTLTLLSSVAAYSEVIAVCPTGGGTNDYAGLGATYETCGTATYSPTELMAAVPNGVPYALLPPWLGIPGDALGLFGSAILFPDFTLTEATSINFDWQSEVELGAVGYMFAAIDNEIAWQYNFGGNSTIIDVVIIGPLGNETLSYIDGGSQSLNVGAGNHSLSFGVVTTALRLICIDCVIRCPGPECGLLNATTAFDPILTISNLGVQGIPEPSTVALLGLGLGTIALFRRRRR